MTAIDLNQIAVESRRAQNGYAWAIDTRDWDSFRTLFTPDVVAVYPTGTYSGIASWLDFFIPFHDGCAWTLHMMTNHLVGADDNGVWASCYGWVQWVYQAKQDRINRAAVVYRDRLVYHDGAWRIAHRRLDQVLSEAGTSIPPGLKLPNSVLDFADLS
jgi:hypothetical protein